MGGLEFNKIFAAILVAGIIAMFGGFVAKQVVHPAKLEKEAFPIEAAEDGAGGVAAPTGPGPILAMMATADVERGAKVAKACAACHTFDKGAPAGVGPNLWGVVGGPKDHMPGYAYSGELPKVGGTTWTYEEMNKFIYKPKAYAANTKMGFAGLKKDEDRAAVLAWLRTQADSPKALPTAAEIAAEQKDLGAATPAAAAAPATAESEAGKGGGGAPAADAGRKGETEPATADSKVVPGGPAKGETSKAPAMPTQAEPAKEPTPAKK